MICETFKSAIKGITHLNTKIIVSFQKNSESKKKIWLKNEISHF